MAIFPELQNEVNNQHEFEKNFLFYFLGKFYEHSFSETFYCNHYYVEIIFLLQFFPSNKLC